MAALRSWERPNQVHMQDKIKIKKTCRCENRRSGTAMGWTAAAGCFVILPLWHCWQSLHQRATSAALPFHTQRAEISLWEARIPGCARECAASKIRRRCETGTRGLYTPLPSSHSSLVSPMATLRTLREEEAAVASVSGHCS